MKAAPAQRDERWHRGLDRPIGGDPMLNRTQPPQVDYTDRQIVTQRVHLERGTILIAWRLGDPAHWWHVKADRK